MITAADQTTNKPTLLAELRLSSKEGRLDTSTLGLSCCGNSYISAPAKLPSDIQDQCAAWYRHLQARSDLGQEGLEIWARKHHGLIDAMAQTICNAILPDLFREMLSIEFEKHRSRLLIIGIKTDHKQLDCLPLELIGHPNWGAGDNVVIWRCRGGRIKRLPVLKLLAIRSAPYDVPLPQNEDDIRAIAARYIQHGGFNSIESRVLTNSTYDEFTTADHDFSPGVVHLATHGTLDSFRFNSSPPYSDLMRYSSVARYFGRRPSVTAVISTACFSAHPAIRGKRDGVCFADQLIEAGVPAAIGMVSKITPWAAQVFCQRFYTELGRMRPMVQAYAEAVLAIRRMRDEDKLLWSVPVMCAMNSNVIPFPSRGYFALIAEMQSIVERIERVRSRIDRMPLMSRRDRIAEANGLSIDVSSIDKSLSELRVWELTDDAPPVVWQEKLGKARTQLGWFKNQTVNGLRQGSSAQQMSSGLDDAFMEIERLFSERYPIKHSR